MEAIFYALVDVTPQDLLEEEIINEEEETVLQTVSKLVKNASQLALNKFPFMKRKPLLTPGSDTFHGAYGSQIEKLSKGRADTPSKPAIIIKTASTVSSLVAHQVFISFDQYLSPYFYFLKG